MNKITSFFTQTNKRQRLNSTSADANTSTTDTVSLTTEPNELNGNPTVVEPAKTLAGARDECFAKAVQLPEKYKAKPLSNFDISLAVNKRLNQADRYQFWTNCFKPPSNYTFIPVVQAKKNRNVQQWWFEKHEHAEFSHIEHGIFCKACVLFGKEAVGKGGNNSAGRLVTEVYRRFKDFSASF